MISTNPAAPTLTFTAWPINTKYFATLPADVQRIMLEEGARAGTEMTRLTLAMEKDYLAKMKGAGMTLVDDVDVAAFAKVTAPAYKAFPKWTPNLHETVMGVLGKPATR